MPDLAISATRHLLLLAFFLGAGAVADDELFALNEITSEGRIVSTKFADFDGDGRKDLMIVTLNGIPPAEERLIAVHLQRPDGSIPTRPSHSLAVPTSSAVFDVADLKDTPGVELLLLRPDALSILSIGSSKIVEWALPVDGPSTVAAGSDELGLDAHRLVHGNAEQALLLVPQIGQVSVFSTDGDELGQISVGSRANYYVRRESSLFTSESDLQLYLDTPKLSVGDIDGDGSNDIMTSTRHEIRVFLRKADGRFDREPDFMHALNLISALDHSRGSGTVVTLARDVNNDGLLDLLITQVEGSFSDTVTTTYFYRNQGGRWNFDNPDEKFVSKGARSFDLLLDIDNDRVVELVRLQFKFSVLEVVEIFLTRKVDSVVDVHRLQENGLYDEKPSSSRKFTMGISFDTFRPKGFMPQAGIDINADGIMDVVTSADGKGMEIYLGTKDEPFTRRTAQQTMPTTGRVEFTDYDGDGLPDFVLFDPQSFDAPLLVGRNLGALPSPDSSRESLIR